MFQAAGGDVGFVDAVVLFQRSHVVFAEVTGIGGERADVFFHADSIQILQGLVYHRLHLTTVVGLIGNIATSGIQVIVDSFKGRDQEHREIGRRMTESFRIQADIGEYQALLDTDKITIDGVDTEVINIHRVGLKDLALCEVTLRRSDENRSIVDLGLS